MAERIPSKDEAIAKKTLPVVNVTAEASTDAEVVQSTTEMTKKERRRSKSPNWRALFGSRKKGSKTSSDDMEQELMDDDRLDMSKQSEDKEFLSSKKRTQKSRSRSMSSGKTASLLDVDEDSSSRMSTGETKLVDLLKDSPKKDRSPKSKTQRKSSPPAFLAADEDSSRMSIEEKKLMDSPKRQSPKIKLPKKSSPFKTIVKKSCKYFTGSPKKGAATRDPPTSPEVCEQKSPNRPTSLIFPPEESFQEKMTFDEMVGHLPYLRTPSSAGGSVMSEKTLTTETSSAASFPEGAIDDQSMSGVADFYETTYLETSREPYECENTEDTESSSVYSSRKSSTEISQPSSSRKSSKDSSQPSTSQKSSAEISEMTSSRKSSKDSSQPSSSRKSSADISETVSSRKTYDS